MTLKAKFGAITTEVAIGIGLAVVVLFVLIGLFNNNISEMISNSSFPNIFNKKPQKTDYGSFGRVYSSSQVNVNIIGEQGLAMIRRDANNKALNLIENDFSNNNANGDIIGYLTLIIKIIVGEPDICIWMNKDSDEICNSANIGGYKYHVEATNSTLYLSKANSSISVNKKSINIKMNNYIANILNNIRYGSSTQSPYIKYEQIKAYSQNFSNYIPTGYNYNQIIPPNHK